MSQPSVKPPPGARLRGGAGDTRRAAAGSERRRVKHIRRLIPALYLCKVGHSPGAMVVEIPTSQQMRRIDRRATARFGVPEIVLMENAGLRMLEALQRIDTDLRSRRLLLLCGK